MEILILLLGGAIGYVIGYSSVIWKLREFIKDAAKSQGLKVNEDFTVAEEKNTTSVRQLEVEQLGDILYLYDRQTKDFVCQAESIDDLAKICKDYNNILLAAVVHNNKIFMFVNGISKEYIQ